MPAELLIQLTERADRLMQDRQLREALPVYTELRAIAPGDSYYPLQIAAIFCQLGEITRALAVLEEVLDAEPENGRALFVLAEMHIQLGNASAAADCFRRLLVCPVTDVLRGVATKFVEWSDTQSGNLSTAQGELH